MKKTTIFLFVLFILILSINLGSVEVPYIEAWKIILNNTFHTDFFSTQNNLYYKVIIWDIRFPRTILAFSTGSALALTGTFMQGITKNPLADPYILGVSSGASTGAILFILLGLQTEVGAFLGALCAILLVFFLVKGALVSNKLILTGVAISAFFSALTNLLIYFTKDVSKVKGILFWMMGSLGNSNWNEVIILTPILCIVILIGFFLSRELDLLTLGDYEANALGLEVYKFKLLIIVLSSLLVGISVSFSGIIGFIGLITPHITRTFIGYSHRLIIPYSVLIGGGLMVIGDILSRILIRPEELPIGIITALLGAPFFIKVLSDD